MGTTEILSGLPALELATLLAGYRTSFHRYAAKRGCQISDSTYNACCDYFQALDTLRPSGSDTNSLFDSDDEIPPLEPMSSSTPEPQPAEEVELFHIHRNGNRLFVPANMAAILTDATEPPSSSDANDRVDEDEEEDDTSDISMDVSSSASFHGGVTMVVPAHTFHVDGEAIERAWAEEYHPPPGSSMGEGYRHSPPENSGPVHDLEIISFFGTREVKCNCGDGKHAVYERHQQFAYVNRNGDLVVKKSQTLFLPLSY
ncbi:hypothetical protein B0H16DRAFT_1740548 [Mycena metata]|uniref:Uncharacterized protein n=1 Tax=Mycena metata TaxID=1033252 RepID=A0AAD7HCJ5_9AGAR|nr:hypothetical protein B0H16DRAFT_1740548 [Mycena metata]